MLAAVGEIIAPYGANEINVMNQLQPPSLTHWFGTDDLGRDVFSRVIIPARPSVMVSIVSVTLALLIGVSIGLLSGFFGGLADIIGITRQTAVFAFTCGDGFSNMVIPTIGILMAIGMGPRRLVTGIVIESLLLTLLGVGIGLGVGLLLAVGAGQAIAAANMDRITRGSEIISSHRDCKRVQDAYTLRCSPQVHGAVQGATPVGRIRARHAEDQVQAQLSRPAATHQLQRGGRRGRHPPRTCCSR